MNKNVECLCCHEVEPLEYFELLGMRYGDMNVYFSVRFLTLIWVAAGGGVILPHTPQLVFP